MRRFIAFFFFVIFSLGAQAAKEYFVSASGKDNGDGTISKPWNFQTALSKNLAPGSVLYLRVGTYIYSSSKNPKNALFEITFKGDFGNPIIIRPYNHEQVIIDGKISELKTKNIPIILLSGVYVWMLDLEITNSDKTGRVFSTPDPDGDEANRPDSRGAALDVTGEGNKIINCVIHDAGAGIISEKNASGSEFYGNLIYNNGWKSKDVGYGNGIQTQNNNETEKFINNIVMPNFAAGLELYSSRSGSLKNYLLKGNTFAMNKILFGGSSPLDNIKFTENNIFSIGQDGGIVFGYDNTIINQNISVTNNYIASSLSFSWCKNVTVTGNSIWNPSYAFGEGSYPCISINFDGQASNYKWLLKDYYFTGNHYYRSGEKPLSYWIKYPDNKQGKFYQFNKSIGLNNIDSWQEDLKYDTASVYYNISKPSGLGVIIQSNDYDSHKLHITIFNLDSLNTVKIKAHDLGLKNGDTYKLHSNQDYFNDTIADTYNGAEYINIPMNNHTVSRPVGFSNALKASTFPMFGTFIFQRKESLVTTALQVPVKTEIDIYPNPVKDNFKIRVEGNYDVEILNSMSQILIQTKVENTADIDTHLLSPGIYFIHLKNDTNTIFRKMLKE